MQNKQYEKNSEYYCIPAFSARKCQKYFVRRNEWEEVLVKRDNGY